MTFGRRLSWFIALVLALTLSTGCVEFFELFEVQAYSESDDPAVRKTGEAIREAREEREVRENVDRFVETGDRSNLDRARELRPGDTEVRGFDVALAQLDGDPAQLEAAIEALTLAEAQRLAAIDQSLQGLTGQQQPPNTAEMIRRNVLGEILVAQTRLLGGSLNQDWSPPPPDAPAETQQLYANYCATRHTIMTEHNDDLSYIPLPPCPPN
jgi:hypothetical protein